MENIPVIDLQSYLENGDKNLCKTVVECLHKTGILIVKDTRINDEYNEKFLDMMEKYYSMPYEIKKKHIRQECHYQVGLTPEFIEKPLDHCELIHRLPEKDSAQKPVGKDPKARWFHRLGKVEKDTKHMDITGTNVIVDEFPEWEETINNMGDSFLKILDILCEMISTECGLEKGYLANLCKYGSHLIAPTFSDLEKYGELKTVLAGFHNDISFLTIHGKSRYPALNIWTRDEKKIRVKVPDGHFLVQSGLQIEYLTGKYIIAGLHEVVVEQDTIDMRDKLKDEGKSSVRVSSTFFSHINSDKYLEILPKFRNEENILKYPKIQEGDWLRKELEKISLV